MACEEPVLILDPVDQGYGYHRHPFAAPDPPHPLVRFPLHGDVGRRDAQHTGEFLLHLGRVRSDTRVPVTIMVSRVEARSDAAPCGAWLQAAGAVKAIARAAASLVLCIWGILPVRWEGAHCARKQSCSGVISTQTGRGQRLQIKPILNGRLAAAAAGPDAFGRAQNFVGSWFGILLLFGWSVALFYHLCNGIRHLFWDAGYGFELPQAYASGWAVVIATGVLTLLAWIVGLIVL